MTLIGAEFFAVFTYSFITSLREVIEAVLVIGIVASYLTRLDRRDLYRDVILGIIAAIVFSIGLGVVFLIAFDELGIYQELFEGVVMLLAAAVLTWMIYWMTRFRFPSNPTDLKLMKRCRLLWSWKSISTKLP